MHEREAIEHLRRGDIRGLEVLVRSYQVRAVRAAYLVTRDVALAQDVVQAAFLRCSERINQLDPRRPFAPWFLTIVINGAIKAAARRDRDASFEDVADIDLKAVDRRPQPDTLCEQAEIAEAVWAALGHLAPDQRAAVVARYYLGLKQAEMTVALRCPPSTVKWRLHAARARLRVLLTPLISTD